MSPTTQGSESEIKVPSRTLEAENDLKKSCWWDRVNSYAHSHLFHAAIYRKWTTFNKQCITGYFHGVSIIFVIFMAHQQVTKFSACENSTNKFMSTLYNAWELSFK